MKTAEEILNTFVNFQVDFDGKEDYRVSVLRESALKAMSMYAEQSTNKVYGAYSGSYDGGDVKSPLYRNVEDARSQCEKFVKDINEEAKRSLEYALESAKSIESIERYNEMYAPMKEIKLNHWRSKLFTVRVVEFDIV